jgi:hypothetical protein
MAAFRREGGVTIEWLRLVAKDLVMPLPENSHPKESHSFTNTPSPGDFPWAASNFRETDGRMPGNFCTNVPLFILNYLRVSLIPL